MKKKLLQLFIPVFLLVFIRYVGFFMFGILPLLFNLLTLKTEYNISDKNLQLSKSYSIIGNHFKNYTVIHGPEYSYSFNGIEYLSSDYGLVTKLTKNKNSWIGFIRDESKEKIKYYVDGFPIFGLSEEELQKRIKNKIEFKAPSYYVSKYGEIEWDSIIKKKFFLFILNS